MCIRDRAAAERDGVDMRMYRVIYDCIEEIEAAMKGMLAPKFRENIIVPPKLEAFIKFLTLVQLQAAILHTVRLHVLHSFALFVTVSLFAKIRLTLSVALRMTLKR